VGLFLYNQLKYINIIFFKKNGMIVAHTEVTGMVAVLEKPIERREK
jgi:hypothetical protein